MRDIALSVAQSRSQVKAKASCWRSCVLFPIDAQASETCSRDPEQRISWIHLDGLGVA